MNESRLQPPYSERPPTHGMSEEMPLALYLDRFTEVLHDHVLKIGVNDPDELASLARLLPAARAIVGCDLAGGGPTPLMADPRIALLAGDVAVGSVREQIDAISPRYDIVIYDSAHASISLDEAFESCFSRVKDGGLLVVQGLRRGGAAAFVHALADALEEALQSKHSGVVQTNAQESQSKSALSGESQRDAIDSVQFFASAAVVRRRAGSSRAERQRPAVSRVAEVGPHAQPAYAELQARVQMATAHTRRLLDALEKERRLSAALGDRVNYLESTVDAIRGSTSWRITELVRWLGTGYGKVRRGLSLAQATWRRTGNAPQIARRVLEVLREKGWTGVRQVMRDIEKEESTAAREGMAQPARMSGYDQWIKKYDQIDTGQRAAMVAEMASWPKLPLVSIIMPTYNADPVWVKQAIDSVRHQIYDRWELCIADDASKDLAGLQVLESLAAEDGRIKLVRRPENGHISAASNSAIAVAEGEWIVLMDHDDLLPEHALYWVVEAINRMPSVRMLYSDEDKVDEAGNRFAPYFKPDWNLDLFRSQNMFSHLGAFQSSLVREVGGFRLGLEGSQDYDLTLRCSERLQPDQIGHIPRVLYHWRMHAQSTASHSEVKPYAQVAAERALNEHLARLGIEGSSRNIGYGYRTQYALPDPAPSVTIIIPTRNGLDLVRQCIESLVAGTDYPDYDVILVDNGSDDPMALQYFEDLERNPRFYVLRHDAPFNYAELNNLAVAQAKGEFLCLLNNDVEVITPDWLREMVSIAVQPGVGAVGARLWYPDGTLQHGGVVLGVGGVADHSHKGVRKGSLGYFGRAALVQSYSAVTGACLVVSKANFERVGGLDQVNLAVAYNDVDFCLRLREQGLRNVWTPYAELIHHESVSRGTDESPEKRARFQREVAYMHARWGRLLREDPAYNPNLTLDRDDFSLAWPPRLKL